MVVLLVLLVMASGCTIPPRERIRAGFGKPETTLGSKLSIREQRAAWESHATRESIPPSVRVEPATSPVPALLITPLGTENSPLIIHFHGGGFVMGSSTTHRGLGIRLALAARARVLLVDYRLAPESRFPAARDDALAVWRWALANGNPPSRIVLSGDSAGAHVALTALLHGREIGVPSPAGLFLISAWLDLAQRGESMKSRAARDPLILEQDLADCAAMYLGKLSSLAPEANPLEANLDDLSPLLLHVGDDEILLSDSVRLAERVNTSGGRVELRVWPRLWHVFHAHAPDLPEANQAIAQIGEFVHRIADARDHAIDAGLDGVRRSAGER